MLQPNDLIGYLIERRLLDEATAVDGEIFVSTETRRNRNYQVHVGEEPLLILKQGFREGGEAGTVAREATVLEALSNVALPTQLSERLPRTAGFDAATGILALQLVSDCEDLRSRQIRIGRASVGIARLIGETLGTLHTLGRETLVRAGLASLPSAVPDVFGLTCPHLEIVNGTSAAARDYVATLQHAHDLAAALDNLAADWRQACLIHGDPRWDNWLVVRRRPRARPAVILLDWEFSTRADPAWDVGSALGDYLGAWVLSTPALPGATLEQGLHLSAFQLERLQPAMAALWGAYASRAALQDVGAELLLAVRYTAAKLVQFGCEQMHYASEMTPAAAALLQLAANIFADPPRAALGLLGITPPPAAAEEKAV